MHSIAQEAHSAVVRPFRKGMAKNSKGLDVREGDAGGDV